MKKIIKFVAPLAFIPILVGCSQPSTDVASSPTTPPIAVSAPTPKKTPSYEELRSDAFKAAAKLDKSHPGMLSDESAMSAADWREVAMYRKALSTGKVPAELQSKGIDLTQIKLTLELFDSFMTK